MDWFIARRLPGRQCRRIKQALAKRKPGFQMRRRRSGQRLAKIKALPGQTQDESGRRSSCMHLGVQSEQGFRCDGMGGVAHCGPRPGRKKIKRRPGSLAGIDEQNQLAALEVQRVLDLKLEFLNDFDRAVLSGTYQPALQTAGQQGAQSIVATTLVAQSKQQNRF